MYLDNYEGEETKIYTIKELQELNPTVEDIEYFVNSASLYLSLTVNMFKFCGVSDNDAEILEICRTHPYFYTEYTWTKEQRAEYEHIMTNIFCKCLDMSKEEAFSEISSWNAMGTAFNLVDYSSEYYNDYLNLVSDLSGERNNKVHKININ